MTTERRRHLAMAIAAILAADGDVQEPIAAAIVSSTNSIALRLFSTTDNRRSMPGRAWKRSRNTPSWFFDYAVTQDVFGSSSWRSLFRVSYTIFQRFSNELRPYIEAKNTTFCKALPAELKVAAFLLYAGGCTCEKAASHLGIGSSTVSLSVSMISNAITKNCQDSVRFSTMENDVALAMKGFESMNRLPYCVGAIDGTHIKWLSCPEEQFYEYRCYKGYPSIVLFAVVTADRKFVYVDIGKPGVLGDSTIYEQSTLKKNIEKGVWLGAQIPHLKIANVFVRPYLIGDCAFQLNRNMMKTCSEPEKNANPVLRTWDKIASKTRKPVECAFGMLKQRFSVLKEGIKLHHENDIVLFTYAYVVLHKWSVDSGDITEAYLPADDDDDPNAVVTAETSAGKKQRDTLLYYVTNSLDEQ